ncbi:hypothetical protein SDC9_50607 [bioreactor metagenome]|uniref:Uncharacterized protein n=1 Tax=bioreactor metagenome TaxID=1076179 RepID=A0A644WKM6_9ZZZZ
MLFAVHPDPGLSAGGKVRPGHRQRDRFPRSGPPRGPQAAEFVLFSRLFPGEGQGIVQGYFLKADLLPRKPLGQGGDVHRADHADLGVSSRGLPVGQHNDGLTVARHLHRAERNGVGDDVRRAGMLDFGPVHAVSHPVGAVGDGVLRPVKSVFSFFRKEVVLGPGDNPERGLGRIDGPKSLRTYKPFALSPQGQGCAAAEGVSLFQGTAEKAPDPGPGIGGPALHHWRHVHSS